MKPVLPYLLALLLSISARAYIVKAKIIDETDSPATGAVASLCASDSTALMAANADSNGEFAIDYAHKGHYMLKVQLIGYETYIHEFKLEKDTDLGEIKLIPLDNELAEVIVTGEQGKVIYKLDRQKINAGSILTASTGTAVDVLKSMSSVRVDSDGEISFRGSTGFLVYVNGQKSMLDGTQALQQIPAASIENIEIITTPSARYRTDGDTGIINITTRRDTKHGFSAAASASGSTMGAYNGDINLSYVHGANRWYVGGIANRLKDKSDFRQTKTTDVDSYLTTSHADGTRYTAPSNYIATAGWELELNGHHLNIEAQHGRTHTERGGHMAYDEHREYNGELIHDNTFNAHDKISNTKHLAQGTVTYSWIVNERGDRFDINGRLRYDWNSLEYTESNLFELTGKRY